MIGLFQFFTVAAIVTVLAVLTYTLVPGPVAALLFGGWLVGKLTR